MQILIVGGGKVGTYLAHLLLAGGHMVKIVEGARKEVQLLGKEFPAEVIIKGNGADPDILEAAGIRTADVVAAVTRFDEMNLVVTSLAKFEYRVLKTIARVNIPKNAWLFTPEMGVDVALNQADLMAHLIIEEMSLGDMMALLKLRKGQYSLVENIVSAGSLADGAAIQDLNLPSECILSAIIRKGDLIIPRGSTVLLADDEVLAVVHVSVLSSLSVIMKKPE